MGREEGGRGEGRGRRRGICEEDKCDEGEEEEEGICEDVVAIVVERISARDYILRIEF